MPSSTHLEYILVVVRLDKLKSALYINFKEDINDDLPHVSFCQWFLSPIY